MNKDSNRVYKTKRVDDFSNNYVKAKILEWRHIEGDHDDGRPYILVEN